MVLLTAGPASGARQLAVIAARFEELEGADRAKVVRTKHAEFMHTSTLAWHICGQSPHRHMSHKLSCYVPSIEVGLSTLLPADQASSHAGQPSLRAHRGEPATRGGADEAHRPPPKVRRDDVEGKRRPALAPDMHSQSSQCMSGFKAVLVSCLSRSVSQSPISGRLRRHASPTRKKSHLLALCCCRPVDSHGRPRNHQMRSVDAELKATSAELRDAAEAKAASANAQESLQVRGVHTTRIENS